MNTTASFVESAASHLRFVVRQHPFWIIRILFILGAVFAMMATLQTLGIWLDGNDRAVTGRERVTLQRASLERVEMFLKNRATAIQEVEEHLRRDPFLE